MGQCGSVRNVATGLFVGSGCSVFESIEGDVTVHVIVGGHHAVKFGRGIVTAAEVDR